MEFWQQVIITLFSGTIGGGISYFIAKDQVDKSEKQQNRYRKEDIERQKLFMINELKLKTTEKLLQSAASVNSNVLNMIHFSVNKHNHFLRHPINYSPNSVEVTEIKLAIQNNFDEFQNYLSDLFTFINLFDIEKENIDFEDLKSKSSELFNKCMNEDVYKTFNREEAEFEFEFYLLPLSDTVVNLINNIDHAVREKQVELIKSMQ